MKTHLGVDVEVVDLCTVEPAELEDLWQHEVRLWRDRLLWDVSAAFAALRRVMQRGGLPGKAVRVDARAVGYAFYGVGGRLGVLSGLVVSPEWSAMGVGEMLLKATIDEIRRQAVARIESPFVSIDCSWLTAAFEHDGFRTYWREVLRLDLRRPRRAITPMVMVELEPWRETDLHSAALMMQAAYDGGVEAEIHQRYRSADGCQVVLDEILNQGGCGTLVAEASAIVRHRRRGIGFIVITEVAPRQGHLAQVAVHPEYQGRGIGQLLLGFSTSQLAERQFDTLSLIVSRANVNALGLYHSRGFQSVLAFPVFIWEA